MRHQWVAAVVAAALVAVVTPLLPSGPPRLLFWFSLSAVALVVLAALVRRRARRAPWWCLVAGFGLWYAGDLASSVEEVGTGFHVSTALYLPGYLLMAVALLLFARAAGPSAARRRAAALEGLAVSVALGLCGSVLLLEPALAALAVDGWAPLAYLLGDLVLASQSAYLLASSSRISGARWLGAVAAGFLLLNDAAWMTVHALVPSVSLYGASGLVSLLLWVASALHPDAVSGERRRRGSAEGVPPTRAVLLVGSLALPPVLLAVLVLVPTAVTPGTAVFDADGWQGLVLAAGGVVLAVLAVLRVQVGTAEERRLRRELQHRADHDPLTGLVSRERALDAVEAALLCGAAGGTALLFIDLDGFKAVNDVHGHLVGDEVLRAVAVRLAENVRPHDVVARFGGDEFVVVLTHVEDVAVAVAVATRLLGAVSVPLDRHGPRVAVGASIGVFLQEPSEVPCDVDALLQAADAAAYRAKAAGKGRVVVHQPVGAPAGAVPAAVLTRAGGDAQG